MLIYFNLIIPIFAIIAMVVWFKHKMAWWEYLIIFIIPFIVISVAKYTSIASQVMTTEYWNTHATKATYYEEWDEWIRKECCAETDTSGNCVRYEDCSYRVYHPAEWEITDNTGKNLSISKKEFELLKTEWNNTHFQEMCRDYYLTDGDAYYTSFNGDFDKIHPICTIHRYVNKIKCSKTVFNFEKIDKEDVKEFGLYEYPPSNVFNYNPIIGGNDIKASKTLQKWNALIGSRKQVHMLILVYHNKPVTTALYQESYWKGGNKNEFILCLGVRDKKIDWAKVISWTEVDQLKVGLEKEITGMNYDLVKISDIMAKRVNQQFIRKEFKDFSYISVEPTDKVMIITFLITIVLTVGLSVFAVLNPYTLDNPDGSHYRHNYFR